MIPPKRIDIGWSDLAAALAACAAPERCADRWRDRAARAFGGDRPAMAALSVRSGFVALLRALDLPRGSEVLMSAITIPEMGQIPEAFGLTPIPMDVDASTLAPSLDEFERRCTPRTRVVVLAHLFGALSPVEPVIAAARERGLIVIEDMAQAWVGHPDDDGRGDARSDVAFFSFGPIKTATALGGAILSFRERALRDAVAKVEAGWPTAPRRAFASRVVRFAGLKLLGMPAVYGAFVSSCRALGIDRGAILRRGVRGFPPGEMIEQLSRRPAAPLLALLARRLRIGDRGSVRRRVADVTRLLERVPGLRRAGAGARRPRHWLLPVLHADPAGLVERLSRAGFDATQGTSTMDALEPQPPIAAGIMRDIVYVPIDGGLSRRQIDRMARVIREFDSRQARPAPSAAPAPISA